MSHTIFDKSYYSDVVVSRLADQIARELIDEFYILAVNNLAFLLEGACFMNDHQVLRIWIQAMIDQFKDSYIVEDLISFIRHQFMVLAKII